MKSNQHTQASSPSKTTPEHDNDGLTAQARGFLLNENLSDNSTIFEAFKEVALDLTFSFSAQNSPAASTSELPPPRTPSTHPPSSPPLPSISAETVPQAHTLSRTMSFASQLSPLSPLLKSKKQFKSTKFSSDQSSVLRGSWPMMKYVGRGTPVDKNKTKEWSGRSAENVGEDGLLFSPGVKPTSLDSSPSPRLSSSSDWDFLNAGLSPYHTPGSPKHPVPGRRAVEEEEEREKRVPPLQKIDIELGGETSEDWASAIQTVLRSTERVDEEAVAQHADPPAKETTAQMSGTGQGVSGGSQVVELPQQELEKLQSELHFDINLDKALDLGFSPVVDFTLAAVTDTDHSNLTIRRAATASSHSQYSTPSEGPSDDRPTVSGLESSDPRAQNQVAPHTRTAPSDVRSATSTKADPCAVITNISLKVEGGTTWWRKALWRVKRIHASVRSHRSVC